MLEDIATQMDVVRGPDAPMRAVGWLANVQTDSNSEPRPNLYNAMLAMRGDPRISSLFAFNEMERTTILNLPVPSKQITLGTGFEPRPLQDCDVSALQELLQSSGLEKIGATTVHQAVELRARERSFHPVRQYLDRLEWDGVPRASSWIADCLGAAPTEYHASIGCMFLTAMVARIYDPGCKVDYMPILEGPQGAKKSAACRVLGGQWFSDNLPDIRSGGKDVAQHLRGKWLIEMAEMSAAAKAEDAALKAFLTRAVERYRPPYGRADVIEPRQCVFIGSTNKDAYLRDETGGRRFWPIRVGTIEINMLADWRDALFAEAVHLYRDGFRWWPDAEFEKRFIAPQQEERHEDDPWTQPIREYIETQNRVTVYEVARDGLHIDLPKLGTADQRRISAVLARLSWRRPSQRGRGPNGERLYYPDAQARLIESPTAWHA